MATTLAILIGSMFVVYVLGVLFETNPCYRVGNVTVRTERASVCAVPSCSFFPEFEVDMSAFDFGSAAEELDSYRLLAAELELEGIEIVGMSSTEGIVIDHEDLHPIDVDVQEFDEHVDAYPIFVIGDAEVQAARLRDGEYFGETVIEETCAGPTAILDIWEEASDADILSLLSSPAEELEFSMGLNPDDFVIEREELPTVDEWLEEQDLHLFVLAATEVH